MIILKSENDTLSLINVSVVVKNAVIKSYPIPEFRVSFRDPQETKTFRNRDRVKLMTNVPAKSSRIQTVQVQTHGGLVFGEEEREADL